jgi:rhodanese-related sulfurtransferase
MNLRSLFAATILVPLGLIAADPAVKHVDAQQAAELLKQKKATVLDVRTANEFKDGHVAGAKHVDFLASDFKAKAGLLDKTKTYLVHCASGKRSTAALPVLRELGFTGLIHLDGGFFAWEDAKLPVEK